MNAVFPWIAHYGYAGLFFLLMLGIVGLPVPDETLLVFCGYLISTRRLEPGWTFASGFLGSSCGISLSYVLGRNFGRRFIHRYGQHVWLQTHHVHQISEWFRRIGLWVLTVGYFVPGVRHFTAVVAGMSRLEYLKFAGFAYAGAAIWVATFLVIGYFVGEEWARTSEIVHRWMLAGTVAVALAIGLYWFVRRGSRKTVR